MELLIVVAVIGAAAFWYYRAYREARTWKEVHAAWGLEHQHRAIDIYNELTRQGILARLRTSGTLEGMMRPITRPHASIRVRREDFASASRIVLSLTRAS